MLSRNTPAQSSTNTVSTPGFVILSPATVMAMQCMGCGGPVGGFVAPNWYMAIYEQIQHNALAASVTPAAADQDAALRARNHAGSLNNFATGRNLNQL